MSVTAGPLWVFALLLVVSGASKLAAPAATEGALRASGLPSSRPLVRILGVGELLVGVAAVALGTAAVSAAVGLLYVGFTGFVVNALVRDLPVASCGCFGRQDTPPTWIHVVVTTVGVLAAVAATVDPPGAVGDALGAATAPAVVVLLTGLAFAFAYMSLTALPKTLGATKGS